MVIVMMGSNCTGKTSMTKELMKYFDVEAYSGKDYLRLAKNENIAWKLFYKKLQESQDEKASESIIIYELAEKKDLAQLEGLDYKKVKMTAELDVIKKRFKERVGGQLPPPLAKMLEAKASQWDGVDVDYTFDTTDGEKIGDYTSELIAEFVA